MIGSGIHETSPQVPLITGATPKRQKKDPLFDALVHAVTAFAKTFTPKPSTPEKSAGQVSNGISPAKTAEVRIKNLEQFKYLQQLYEDGTLTHDEF